MNLQADVRVDNGCELVVHSSIMSDYSIVKRNVRIIYTLFITSTPFNVLAALALYPSLHLLGHLHHTV